jgi:chaperonin GroES
MEFSNGLPVAVRSAKYRESTPHKSTHNPMTGTANQVEWAEQIKIRVSADFDRVARALALAASKQTEEDRVDTLAVIAILEDKRATVMGKDEAGYFIHDWQELSDQVRQMIVQDPRYKRIKINQELARRISQINPNWRLNSMLKIRPLSDRIVVKRIAEQETLRSGIIIPDSAQEKPQEAEVIAVGLGKRLEDGTVVPVDVKVGDRIVFGKYSSSDIKLDGEEYLIMREDEILGVMEQKPKTVKQAG